MEKKGREKRISRLDLLRPVKRVVVKVGSGVLTTSHGLNKRVINDLTDDVCALKKKGVEVILVSSGAIASGLKKIGMAKRPESISHQQAVAAIGQSTLMMVYEKAFGRHGQRVAQVLITRDDLHHRRRYLNARNTLFTLLSWKIVPIINENDTVVVDEIKFGDNDNLSAMVTNLTESQLLINLTDIDGFFNKDPRIHKDARPISVVEKVNKEVMRYASAIPGFLGTGGMAAKIRAAQKVAFAGAPTIIANGLKRGILKNIFMGKEEGTIFMPREAALCSRKHWIAFTRSPKGEVLVDRGAEAALLKRGKSLLPSGIKEVRGRFSLGDSVVLLNEDEKLGFKHDDEVIHRDNLVLTGDMEEGMDVCQLRA
jgi:glutamate 5-kinase